MTNVSCSGTGDGSIDLTSSGGSGTFLFDWIMMEVEIMMTMKIYSL